MTSKKYLAILSIIALISYICLFLVIVYLEPCKSFGITTLCDGVDGGSLLLFFLSALIGLTSTFSLLGFGLRFWLHGKEIYLDHVTLSLRQGFLLALCALSAFILLPLHALTWWTGLLLISIIVLLEVYFTRDA